MLCILKNITAYAIMPIGKKRVLVHEDKERIPQPCCSTVGGFFFSFYSGKAPTRLFVTLVVPVQLFTDQVADQTRRHRIVSRISGAFHKALSAGIAGFYTTDFPSTWMVSHSCMTIHSPELFCFSHRVCSSNSA